MSGAPCPVPRAPRPVPFAIRHTLTMSHILKITGMHCNHCRETVKKALNGVAGVYGASVDLSSGRAEVDGDARVEMGALIAAVEAVGYGAARDE